MTENNNMQFNRGTTAKDVLQENKRKIASKFLWCALSVIGIIILLTAFVCIISGQGRNLKKSKAEEIALNALKLNVDNASSLKILDISEPDSVFVNRLCPEHELMELSEKFLEHSLNIMQNSQYEDFETDNSAYKCKMERYSESSNALNTLNTMLDRPQGQHNGWRVKVKYQAVDDSDTPYISEAWFIFDLTKNHIIKSFDISLL